MGGDSKYGRLFTERDVEMMLRVQHDRSWSACSRDMDERALAPSIEECRPLTVEDAAREADELNLATGGLTFPADEPLFLLRGQDEWAEETIRTYERTADLAITVRMEPKRVAFRDAVRAALAAFQEFARNCPERVKAPD